MVRKLRCHMLQLKPKAAKTKKQKKEPRFGSQDSLCPCVTLGKLFNLSMPQMSHKLKKKKSSLIGLDERMYMKSLE